MKKTILCTKERPLHQLINDEEKNQITEIIIAGYLGGDDLVMPSDMSKYGSLRLLDMHDVKELNTEDLWDLEYYPFSDDEHIEDVVLPEKYAIDFPMFIGCKNLKRVDFSNEIEDSGIGFLSDCPNIEEIYVPGDLQINYDGRYQDDDCFVGSGKCFVSDIDEWPEDLENIASSFFSCEGVLYDASCRDISLYRYPAGDERLNFVIPEGVAEICEYAFYSNPYLRSVTIPQSVKNIQNNPFVNCQNLETIIFKNKVCDTFTCKDAMYAMSINPYGLCALPHLKDIYIYAESPEEFPFSLFYGMKNIEDVTLHVPCFCAKKFKDYEIEYYNYSSNERKCEKPWRKFKSIEEFDPVDFIDIQETYEK